MYSLIHVSSSEVSVMNFCDFFKMIKRSRACDLQDSISVLQYYFYIFTFKNILLDTYISQTSFASQPHSDQNPTLYSNRIICLAISAHKAGFCWLIGVS